MSNLIQVDKDTWINKDEISSLTIVRDRENFVSVVLYVARRTISVDVKKTELTEFIEKLQ